MKKYKALVLDMDGTIINSLDAVVGALEETARAWRYPITDTHIDLARYSSGEALYNILELADRDKALFMEEYGARYHENARNNTLFPGISALLSAPVPCGIVTNESRDELLQNLDRFGLVSRFQAFGCAGDTPFEKPHPRPLLYCLEQMKTAPRDAIFVGDSRNDMLCAGAAGVDFGLALWGADPRETFEDALHVFKRPEDIL
ncbi:MAG: HAD family hydrolase, partial [Oscillospiraceae bacterium]|nr:HAD family hydrolase [Oscillospiraceae bacterium]